MWWDVTKNTGTREWEIVPPVNLHFHKKFTACDPPVCKLDLV